MPTNAVDVNDVTIDSVLFHDLQSLPGCNGQTQNVGVEDFPPSFGDPVRKVCVGSNPGVIDEDVDWSQVLLHPLEAFDDRLFAGDVDLDCVELGWVFEGAG